MSVAVKSVLVISEVADTNKKITETLVNSGFEVSIVSAESDCLSRLSEASHALVFISLVSPSIDALRLVTNIRQTEADLPLILVADASSADQIAPTLQGGATDYLLFPVPDALIYHVAKKNIDRRRENRRRRRNERELKKLNNTLVNSLKVLERDQQAGFKVQQGMMPESPFLSDRLTLQHRIVPSLILSGDFIDYFELPDRRLLFYIADVSGHGASGAIVTVLLKSLSSRLYNELDELGLADAGEILGWLNQELLACNLEQHVTMFLGLVDQNENQLQYASAGHFPATILSSSESTTYLHMGGLPIGLTSPVSYPSHEITLPRDFTMVMFSDGVFEVMPQTSLKAKEEHLLSLVECDHGDIDRLAAHLGLGEVTDAPDDIAVFTVARAG